MSHRQRFTLPLLAAAAMLLVPFVSSLAQDERALIIEKDVKIDRYNTVREPVRETAPDTTKANRHWKELTKGMTEEKVRALLGVPERIQMDGQTAIDYWWYGRRAVAFSRMTKKVLFWDQERLPPIVR